MFHQNDKRVGPMNWIPNPYLDFNIRKLIYIYLYKFYLLIMLLGECINWLEGKIRLSESGKEKDYKIGWAF